MTADETMGEMLFVLWRAARSYADDSEVPFTAYYWTLWKRHRANYLRSYFAESRGRQYEHTELDEQHHPLEDGPEHRVVISTPPTPKPSEEEVAIWRMLCEGFLNNDVIAEVGMSRRRYYKTISEWKEAMQ
jgi:hypothetical protein